MSADISNLDKAEVLCALFNNAFVNGYCYEGLAVPKTVEEAGFDRNRELTVEEARNYLDLSECNFIGRDIRGRWLEVNLQDNELDLDAYNEHFGCGGEHIIARLRESGNYSKLTSPREPQSD